MHEYAKKMTADKSEQPTQAEQQEWDQMKSKRRRLFCMFTRRAFAAKYKIDS